MKIHLGLLIAATLILASSITAAQAPVLSSIETPYPGVQSQVTIGVVTYGPGAVEYGPVGTPLVITGSNFAQGAVLTFPGSPRGATVQETAVTWNSNFLIANVPVGATTGLVTVTSGGSTSNSLPFMVTNGRYVTSCPTMPYQSNFRIVTSFLQDGTVGQSYSLALGAVGGTAPYTWKSIGNALPSGLSLSSSGTISGTPTASTGPINLTIQATDANQETSLALLPMSVDPHLVTAGPVYSYSVPSGGYDAAGNLLSYSDSVMGTWSFTYDSLNRLQLSSATSGDFDGQYGCWNIDNFGNRQQQVFSSAPFQSGSGGASSCKAQASATVTPDIADYNSQNRLTSTNALGVSALLNYDGAGNATADGIHTYRYDPEGRVCAVETDLGGGSPTFWGYIYDAEGQRVAKGTINGLNCDPSSNGFQLTDQYILGQGGEELATMDGAGHWKRANVYGAGKLLATYDASGLHFHLSDPLGSRRVQTNSSGLAEIYCKNLPFGDQQNCFSVSAADATPLHYTGKERDIESGNDYFGARYYGSSMGRFLSPDPITVTPARVANPQQLNLYAYVANNPLRLIDPTGMIIDDAACKQDPKHCGNDWQKVQNLANQKYQDGSYAHRELHQVLSDLQENSRTFTIENSSLGAGTAGQFTITEFTTDGKDFTNATLQLDFKQIKGISGVTGADLVPGFNKFQGVLDSPIKKLAEVFGHEGEHGEFAIYNPAQAVRIQQLLNDRDAAMHGQHYPYPPDVMQKIAAASQALIPTEEYAQQAEKIINGELQAKQK